MIKYWTHICLILTALVTLLVGCDSVPTYDQRLVQVDSLLNDRTPDKRKVALEQIEAIAPDELTNSADRAYHALLLTQARYLNYVRIDSDKDINIACDYYEQQGKEPEKLARANIFKGTTYEDLNKPDSAMIFYKKAEVTAGDSDPFNRGYALLRMGKLYNSHHAYDGRDIEKLELALECFRKCNSTFYQIVCLNDLGALYRPTNKQKAEMTLNDANELARSINDTANIIKSTRHLAYLYFMQGVHDRSYNLKAYKKLQEIKSMKLYGLDDNVYTTFANIYATMGMPDSALWYLGLSAHSQDSIYLNSNNYLESKAQIAKARGDSLTYLKLSYECDRKSFSLLNDPDIVNIMYAELRFDDQYRAEQEKLRQRRNYVLGGIMALVILSLLLAALLFYRRSHRYDRLVIELKDQSQSQMQDLSGMQQSINELQINDERLKGFITSHMSMMREMIETCYHEPNNRIAENMKRIVKFQDSNKDNWVKLYDYIDLEHDNIMTRTRENYPQLNDRELLLLALTCMGYSYIHIAIIMGYSNATSVSVIKQRLVKKMGLECTLNEYIQKSGKI